MLISRFDTTNAEEKIIALEKQYGITLPEQYRTFLGRYNGGETPETSFRMAGVSSDLIGFFGLGISNAGFQLEQYFSYEEISDMTAKGKFPIGKNSFGDLLFISIQSDSSGEVLFQYHDRDRRYLKLANTFSEFISKCRSKKIKPCRSIEERLAGRKAAGIFDPPPPIALQEWQKEIDRFGQIHQEKLVL